jgi:hypothetical protein
METELVEIMAFCIALLEHVTALSSGLPDLDDGKAAMALPELSEGMGMLVMDEEEARNSVDALRPMIREMPTEDMQEGAAFCFEMIENS